MLMRWVHPFILDKTKYWLNISFCGTQNIFNISKSLVTIFYFSIFTCVYVIYMCMYFFACLCMHVEHALVRMFVCMCVHICLYAYVCTYVWVHVEIWGWCWKLPWSLLDLILRVRVSQPIPELADMTTFLTCCFGIPCFSLLRLELQEGHHAYQQFMWASGDQNSGPHSPSLTDI